MSIPLATTTIAVRRITADLSTVDPYEVTAVPETVASGIRAHIGSESGTEAIAGISAQEDIGWHLDCDITDLVVTDQVYDETTGLTFQVVWAAERHGLGLDHIEGGLRRVVGVT